MRWININEKYLDYLRSFEKRIPYSDYGDKKYKPFFGVLFEVGDLYYVTQVSHPQKRHYNLKQQKDFYKIYDPKCPNRLIAVVNLNYMFPVPATETSYFHKREIHTYRKFDSEIEKSKYVNLLDIELQVVNSMSLDNKARYIYELKYKNPMHFVSKRCIDFKEMEKLAKKFLQCQY